MAKEFIVAIELGSSKVTGIAGQKNLDGSITVLAVVKEESSPFIRKGVVYNIDKTAQCLQSIVKKLENQLKQQVRQVYVGVSGQSIRGVRNTITKDLPAGTIVTEAMVDELVDANRNMDYPDQEILDTSVQEYKVDSQYQLDPVGIQCSRIEGNFLNILQRKAFYKNLNKCFESAGIIVAEMYLAPLALADSVLTETEKRSGCALVDIGADTTTVNVYFKNILRHLAVIPLGSNNITKDIASLQMEESDAEKMKLKYGCAYTENNDIDNNMKYAIDQVPSVPLPRKLLLRPSVLPTSRLLWTKLMLPPATSVSTSSLRSRHSSSETESSGRSLPVAQVSAFPRLSPSPQATVSTDRLPPTLFLTSSTW